VRFLRDDLERRIVRLAIPALGTLAVERWLGRRAVYNLLGYLPLALATLLFPALGLAGLWGAQLTWMTMRAWVNARRWHALAARDFT